MINKIKNNTISETDAKQKLNELDEIKKVETKNKRLISSQKILLNLFDDEEYYKIEQINDWFKKIGKTK